jgi:hypothetical protein
VNVTGTTGATQALAAQVEPAAQEWPHAPQLFVSVVTSTHAEPHVLWPATQLGGGLVALQMLPEPE